MYNEDTIAAISTAQGTGGIGIIRVSGSRAFEIGEKLFRGKKPFNKIKSHTISFGKIINPEDGQIIDEVLLSKMNGPKTFTAEDTIEINCHGGLYVLKTVLELVVKYGARLAEAGEFTKRAFLNGRMDLSQAEAVIDIINAKTEAGNKAAIDQLEGKLSQKLKVIRQKLIELIAHIEVTVDYPEHDIEEITGEKVYSEAKSIEEQLENLVKGFDKGRIIREGLNLVIIGRPNVGKSSLLNELTGKNKAIVTDIPGTTRDIIEEYINIDGIPVRIIDTAGIRETDDLVEKIGVERAKNAVKKADMIVVMVDAAEGLTDEDLEIMGEAGNKKFVLLINKIDIAEAEDVKAIRDRFKNKAEIITASVKEGTGIEELENHIVSMVTKGEVKYENEFLLTNVRHKDLIDKALHSIKEAIGSYEGGMPLDLITIDIKNTAEYLGQITGESVNEDVIHEIFSRFCIGK